MLRRSRPLLLLGAALAVFAVFLTGCAGDEAATAVGPGTVVLDVRTPGEYADGHLEGARNIDLQSPTFDSEIAALDPDAEYVVYCRSGSRSALAAARMADAGVVNVTDAGGIDRAATETGLPIVAG